MKSFLSHSSKDKAGYVRLVAEKLGDLAVYDEFSFESGMKTLDEIMRGLGESEIFVLFISASALESEWVKREISESKVLLDDFKIKRFLPILIDRSIDHNDSRIPKWIKENYNLRLVSKPNVAFRRINTVFNQLSLGKHPLLAERKLLFVGRNSQLQTVERRLDDYTKQLPSAIIVAGMRDVGRKSFLLHALRKSNKISASYNPIVLPLQQEDGIDGIISKIIDIGFYPDEVDIENLSEASMDEKQRLLVSLLTELSNQNEVLLIDDWRCIVRYGGELPDWFLPVCRALPANRIVLAIASATLPKMTLVRHEDSLFAIKIPELDPDERLGLLVRFLRDIEGIYDLETGDLDHFRPHLNGYPEQAIYAGQIISAEGIFRAKERIGDIEDFSNLKASVYVEKYRDEEDIFDFLVFLSWFDFLSLDIISKIQDETDKPLLKWIDLFLDESLCDLVGSVGEYIRLNDIVKDYVARGSLEIPTLYSRAIRRLSREIFKADDLADFDYSEKYASVRVALLAGKEVPDRLLIPAHFLGAIAQKYKNRKYQDVITLSYRVLQRTNYEEFVRSQIRHYLCMALARTRDSRFLTEVQLIKGNEHNYVLGFYYRIMGRYEEAIKRFERAIDDGRWEENSKREIVLIHNIQENFSEALSLARESYRKYPSNAITVQAYFEVLLNMPRDSANLTELRATMETIKKISGEKAEEVRRCMEVRYKFNIEHATDEAVAAANEAITRFEKSPYPVLAKLEIGLATRNIHIIESALQLLKERGFSDENARVQIKKAQLILLAIRGFKEQALSKLDSELGFLHPMAKERLRQRILGA